MHFTGWYQWAEAPMHRVGSSSTQHPKKELSNLQSIWPSSLNKKHTIDETKCQKVCNTQNDGQMLNNGDLDSDEHAGTEHDGRNSKAIGVSQILKIFENRNHDNCRNHKSPIASRDVNLALDCLRCMDHANRWKRSAVNDLLNKTESSGNQRLWCNELNGQLVKPEMFEKNYYCRKNSKDKHDPKQNSEVRERVPLTKIQLTSIMDHLQVLVWSCKRRWGV